jgi:hypothetical protein
MPENPSAERFVEELDAYRWLVQMENDGLCESKWETASIDSVQTL